MTCKVLPIKIFPEVSTNDFEQVLKKREPVILRGCNIGLCREKWTSDYLQNVGFEKMVKVHVSSEPKLDFITKNFLYKTLPFGELVRRASGLPKQSGDYFLKEGEYYYLRALGSDPRKDVAFIEQQFPELASDFKVPDFLENVLISENREIFSSVLRIASPGLVLWTHYDVMDNVLVQVMGRKRAVLFDPQDCEYLYLNGDKSSVMDIDNPDLSKFPNFPKARRFEGIMEPGDCIFIPALWFHNMTALDFGVAVNIFWKHPPPELYDSKDPYGNKDPVPAQRAFMFLSKALKDLEELPEEYKLFYKHTMISRIRDKL